MHATNSKWLLVAVVVLGAGLATSQEATRFELQQPKLYPSADIGHSAFAGLADLGMRTVESGAEAGLFIEALGLGLTNPSSSVPYVLLGADVLLVLGAPAIEALVCSWIGDGHHRHPFGPLLVTSYASHLAVDGLTYALLGTSYAGIVYVLGSALGSAAMGTVHAVTAAPIEGPAALPSSVALQRVPPVAAPQGAVFRF
jgi:hypothetical protein